jgi:hypothetical protein
MAPEQARGQAERIDHRADVFGLGAVLYELLTGRPPHAGATLGDVLEHAKRGAVTPPHHLSPRIPRRLEAICLKALAPAPEKRYASADEFRRALRWYSGAHTRRSAILGAVALTTLAPVIYQAWPSPERPSPAASKTTEASQDLRILDFEIMHYPKANKEQYESDRVRRMGEGSFGARFEDEVKIRATLSERTYSYLIAFGPDGIIRTCDPVDETFRPSRTRGPGIPAEPGGEGAYRLNDGVGLQAFALVVSRQPLPPLAEWEREQGRLPWPAGAVPGAPGVVWRHDGQWLTTRYRDDTTGTRAPVARAREARGGGGAVEALARWLRTRPGVAAVAVEAFTVEPSRQD